MTVTLDLQFGLNRVFCFRIFAIIKMSIETVISFQGPAAKGSPSNLTWLLAEFRALQGTGQRASISCWILVWGFLQFHRALNRQFQQHRQFSQHPLDHRERRVPEKHPFLLYWLCQSLCMDHNKLWKILQTMGIPDHLTCHLRNLYAGQEVPVRTRHGTKGWFQIVKGVHQGCIYIVALLT